MSFPEIGLAHAPEIEISKKWTSSPGIQSVSCPRKLKFRKNSGWLFQDLPIRVNLGILSKRKNSKTIFLW